MGHSHSARCGAHWLRGAIALSLSAVSGLCPADEPGLHAPDNSITAHSPSEYALAHTRAPANSVRLFGDYYLFDPAQSTLGPTMGSLIGGFRVSTGVVGFSQTLSLFDTPPESAASSPYIGLGYSHLWFNSQLTFNADFGLASQGAGAGRARGLFNGAPSFDDVAGDLRWAPVMAVNVHYSF
jgi:hypothetical protein